MSDSQPPARPAPFSAYTTIEMWNDPHISEHMLRHHLDSSDYLCSRPHDFIDRSVSWISERFGVGSGTRILDLGCGPGLYAIRLARLGARVTGVDVSARSIEYARQIAAAEGLDIDYRIGSYLDLDFPDDIDLALLIYRDFCAMSPKQRHTFLTKVRDALRPEGALLFDVDSPKGFESRGEEYVEVENDMGGLWAPGDYLVRRATFLYPEERLVLNRHEVVTEHLTRVFYDWCQHLAPDEIEAELAEAGLCVETMLGSVAGDPFDPDAPESAVVARVESRE